MRQGYTRGELPPARYGRERRLRLLRAALQDREQVEADEVDDALFFCARALARELAAEHAGSGELRSVSGFLAAHAENGLAREEAPRGVLRQGAGAASV